MLFTRFVSKLSRRHFANFSTFVKKMPDLQDVFKQVDTLKPQFIKRLGDAVAIPSVSAEAAKRKDVVRMGEFIYSQLKDLGASDVELRSLGKQPDDPSLDLPPIVIGRYGTDPAKKTVLVYGHYDVQPALVEDGWNTDPFKLTESGGVLYGRGATDDKGPVMGWLNVLQVHQDLGRELPVNLVFCFEGMEESGSVGLDEFVAQEASGFYKDVDAVCISDNYWLGTDYPVVTYGVRGVQYYEITVKGPAADLHSGLFGGLVHEPMTDLVQIMAQLVTPAGEILIPGVKEMVAPLTKSEEKLYDDIHFDIAGLEANIGSKTVIQPTIQEALQARWRYPSLSLHGIEGAFYEKGAKTVIPAQVSGKFSIRTVPDIDAAKLDQCVFDYVKDVFKKLNSKNTMNVSLVHGGDYWVADPSNWNYRAAAKATKAVWGLDPDFTREGGSIPITLSFQELLKTSVVLLPLGRGDDGAHSTNEKFDISNYVEGTKTLAAYLYYLAEEKKD